ncbi:MAG: FKBP-type peptidyl-prolyl cis-trans isomerase [Planctomycetota bacterium]
MRSTPTILAALAVAVLASCATEENPDTTLPPEVADAPAAEEPTAEEPAVAAPDADMSAWAVGGTIPHDRAGVRDIEILEVRANGTGPVCGNGKRASLAYVAMKADGEVLDEGERPFTFTVGAGGAIPGWDIIVAQMRIGDDFTIFLPKELAYGDQEGDLKFNIKLLSFE